jgi:hypothetical protein
VIEGGFTPHVDNTVIIQSHNKGPVESNWSWHSLQGSLISLQEMGITIIYDPDFHGAVDRLVRRSRNDVKVAPRRQAYVFSPVEQVYMSFDGIGSDRAQKIAVEFPNVGEGLQWLTDLTAKSIAGIGVKTKTKIIEQIGGRIFFASENNE